MGSYQGSAIFRLLICPLFALSLSGCVAFDQDEIPDARVPGEEPVVAKPAAPSSMDLLRTLSPPEGLKTTQLFSQPVSDSNARLKRLEEAVQNLRNDLDTALPVIVRSGILDKDKVLPVQEQALSSPEIIPDASGPIPLAAAMPATPPAPVATKKSADVSETTTIMSPAPPWGVPPGAKPPKPPAPPPSPPPAAVAAPLPLTPAPVMTPAAPPPQIMAAKPQSLAPMPKPVVAKPLSLEPLPVFASPDPVPEPVAAADPPPPPVTIVGDVRDIRISDYPDMTRVVLDMTARYGEEIAIANSGKTLVIPLTQFAWTGEKAVDLRSAQLVSGYHIENNALRVDLMYPAMIKHQLQLDPTEGIRKYRLVIDLFSPDVHRP